MKKFNFIEAIKFLENDIKVRIAGTNLYYDSVEELIGTLYEVGTIKQIEIIYSKFELEEKEITITESQLDEAMSYIFRHASRYEHNLKKLKEELGF